MTSTPPVCRPQVENACARYPDRFAYAGHLVGRQVVHHDDVALCPCAGSGARHPFDVGAEGEAFHGATDQEGRHDPVGPQAGHKGAGLPVASGCGVDQALAARPPSVAAGHGGGARFIQEHEALRVHVALPHPPAPPILRQIRSVLLGGPQ